MTSLIDTSRDDYADLEDIPLGMQGIIIRRSMKKLFEELMGDIDFFAEMDLEPRKFCVKVSVRIQ